MEPNEPVNPTVATPEMQPPAATPLKSIGALLSDAYALFRERWSVLVGISLLWALVSIPLFALVFGSAVLGAVVSGSNPIVIVVGAILCALVFGVALLGFLWTQVATLQALIGEKIGVTESFKRARPATWNYTITIALSQLIAVGMSFFLVLPGIYYSTIYGFAGLINLAEGKKGKLALVESESYVRGRWWPVFGRVIFFSLVAGICSFLLQIVLEASTGKNLSSSVMNVLNLFLVTPFSYAYFVTVFKNVRSTGHSQAVSSPSSLKTPIILASLGFVLGIAFMIGSFVLLASLSSTRERAQQAMDAAMRQQQLIDQEASTTQPYFAPEGSSAQ